MDGIAPQQQAEVLRSQRLMETVNSAGFADVLRISEAIANEQLREIESYSGTDEHHIAVLAFCWKTLRAHHKNLLATIAAQIAKQAEILGGQPESAPTMQPLWDGSCLVKPLYDMQPEEERPNA